MVFISLLAIHKRYKRSHGICKIAILNEKNRHVLILSYLSITLKQSMALSRIVTLSHIEEINSMISIAY